MRTRLSKLPFTKLPFSFSQIRAKTTLQKASMWSYFWTGSSRILPPRLLSLVFVGEEVPTKILQEICTKMFLTYFCTESADRLAQDQKNPRAHKNKIGTPPHPPKKNPKYPPPVKRGILWTWFSCRTDACFPGVHKIGAAISGPRITDKNFTDTRIFLREKLKGNN